MEAKNQLLIPPKNEENNDVKEEHFHVLAVDDSVIERKMLEKLLTISSYHVTCVESGDKALEFLGLVNCHSPAISDDHHDHDGDDHNDHNDDGGHGYDDDNSMICHSLPLPDEEAQEQDGQGTRVNLIMTDYSMPGMSGYDLLKRVKGSSWKDVPVVVMSSENVPSRIHMCLEEGAEEFLLKPVRLSDLKKLQPRILKQTPSTTTSSTVHYCCETESSENSTLLAVNDIDNINSKVDITTGDDHKNYTSNSNDGKDEEKIKFKNEMEQFVKSSKLDQLVM